MYKQKVLGYLAEISADFTMTIKYIIDFKKYFGIKFKQYRYWSEC